MHPISLRTTRQHGFSLPELMVSMAIGLIVLAGLATMFVTNSKAQAEMEKTNRQVENGRFAISLMGADLRHAGFYGEFDPRALAPPTLMPDPCATALADLKGALPLPIQGIDNAATATPYTCLSDVRIGTDVVVVRRTATCVLDSPGCDASADGGPFFQASLCNNASELNSTDPADFYAMTLDTGTLKRHQHDCTDAAGTGTLAVFRRYKVYIYYVANNDQPGDKVPTLKRAELVTSGGTTSVKLTSQVNGVENLQVEYGLDTGSDGVADLFTANPSTYNSCSTDACAIVNWGNVVAVKINILSRNLDKTAGYSDSLSYVMGNKADGTPNTIAAPADGYKRHVFQSQMALPNPAGRKIP